MSNLVAEDPASFVASGRSGDRPAARRAERPDQAAGLGRRRRHAAADAGDRPLPLAQRPERARCATRCRAPAASAGISTARASSTSSARSTMPATDHGRGRPRRALVHRPEDAGLRPDRDQRAASGRPLAAQGTGRAGRRSPASCARSCSRAPRPRAAARAAAQARAARDAPDADPPSALPAGHHLAAAWAGSARSRRSTCRWRGSCSTMPGAEVGWQDGRAELNHVKDNRLLVLPRDTLFEVQSIERLNALGLQPLGPTGLGRFAPENCRQDFTFEEDEDDDVAMRWVEFNHADLPKLARRRLAHHLRRGLSLSGGRSRRRLEGRHQRFRHRLVRSRPRHRGRRRAGGAAADPARPVRAGAGGPDARPRSTSSARTMSSARCPTAGSCRSRPPG